MLIVLSVLCRICHFLATAGERGTNGANFCRGRTKAVRVVPNLHNKSDITIILQRVAAANPNNLHREARFQRYFLFERRLSDGVPLIGALRCRRQRMNFYFGVENRLKQSSIFIAIRKVCLEFQ